MVRCGWNRHVRIYWVVISTSHIGWTDVDIADGALCLRLSSPTALLVEVAASLDLERPIDLSYPNSTIFLLKFCRCTQSLWRYLDCGFSTSPGKGKLLTERGDAEIVEKRTHHILCFHWSISARRETTPRRQPTADAEER